MTKPPIVPPKSEAQRIIESWGRSYNTPRPIKLDPTIPDGFRDIATLFGIATAWERKVRALEAKLERALADDPYNLPHIKALRKSLATAKLGQQYA